MKKKKISITMKINEEYKDIYLTESMGKGMGNSLLYLIISSTSSRMSGTFSFLHWSSNTLASSLIVGRSQGSLHLEKSNKHFVRKSKLTDRNIKFDCKIGYKKYHPHNQVCL